MSPLPLMGLSQSHLNALFVCPRRFQHTYLDQLNVPTMAEQQARVEWGTQFHQLMQQWALGLPITGLVGPYQELAVTVEQLQAAAPDFFQQRAQNICLRQSEHRRILEFEGYLLTVVYDWLSLTAHSGQIVDWKTYPLPQDRQALQQNWQTRLYLFVLAETTDLPPDALSMVYWFVRHPNPATGQPEPQSIEISYTAAQHEQNRADLRTLTQTLTRLRSQPTPFPQLPQASPVCPGCAYAARCGRGFTEAAVRSEWQEINVDTIPEIPL